MRVIDREPTVDMRVVVTSSEGPVRPALFEVPVALRGRSRFGDRSALVYPSRDRLHKRRGSGRSRQSRGCGNCSREATSSSVCTHPRIPGLKLNSPILFSFKSVKLVKLYTDT